MLCGRKKTDYSEIFNGISIDHKELVAYEQYLSQMISPTFQEPNWAVQYPSLLQDWGHSRVFYCWLRKAFR